MNDSPRLAAVYLRVSTLKKTEGPNSSRVFEQDPETQRQPVMGLIARRGWTLYREYFDRAPAGGKRPEHARLMEDARRRRFDVVVVWKFDRFARSTQELLQALDEFHARGIEFVSDRENVDTTTPMGRAMFGVIAVSAEFERDLIRERVLAGMARAKVTGTKSGLAIGRPRKIMRRDRIAELRAGGLSWRAVAAELGAKVSTVRDAFRGENNSGNNN